MTFIDYQKALDVLPSSWIIVSLELIGLNKKISFTKKATSDRIPSMRLHVAEKLTETEDVKIECGIFENSLSPASFFNSLIPLKKDFKKLNY